MKKMLLFGLLTILALVAYGCQTVQTIPKPIEQTPVQNQTLISSSPCSPSETFIPDFLDGYECQPTSVIKACEAAGGNWRMFGNGCGDSCGEKPRICTLAFQPACDCGTTRCYGNMPCNAPDGVSCPEVIRLGCIADSYEPYTTPIEACDATNGTWQKVGERCPTIEEVRVLTTITPYPDALGRCSASNILCGGIAGGKCPNAEICTYGLCETECGSSNSIKINICPVQRIDVISCKCPQPLTFGLQGCKEYPLKTNELMSIVGGWQ